MHNNKSQPNFILSLIFMAVISIGYSQSVGINTLTPDPSAALDIQSTTRGLLIPRMTQVQIDALLNPADGLLVYNIDTQNTIMFVGGLTYDLYNTNTGTSVTLLSGASPSIWLNISNLAPTELLGLNIHRIQKDLSGANEIRIVANTTGLSLGLAGSLDITLQYSTNGGASWNYLNSLTSGPGLSISVAGLVSSPWTSIDAAAKQDVQLRLIGQGSGGIVLEAGLGLVMLEIR